MFRIGFDATPLLGPRSGVGNYTLHLIEHLIQGNPELEAWLYSNRPIRRIVHDISTLTQRLQQVVQPSNYFTPSRLLWMHTCLARHINRHALPLTHFPNNSAPLGLKQPYIITIHDASLYRYRQYHPWQRVLAIRVLLPLVARRAAAIITPSHHAKQEITSILQLPKEKVHVVHEAAGGDFRPITDRTQHHLVRQTYQLPQHFILYVGTLEPRKNLIRLAHAFAQLRQQRLPHHLILVGSHGWKMAGFDEAVEQLNIGKWVHQIGFVPDDHLATLYSLADLFAFPSLYEGFGLPPLEAMACGTPVLTSHNTSMAEICGSAAYLVDPHDTDAIASGMRQILCDGQLSAELSQRGLQHVRRYSWENTAQQTLAIYRQFL